LAILDVTMPRMTGLQAARELRRRGSETKVLVLSMHDNEQYLYEALKAGASGYVLKSAAHKDLVEACRAAMRGEPFLYPGAVTALIVRDDGRGIRPGDLTSSHGISGMRERAMLINAQLAIGPGNGRGTEVRLTIPLDPTRP